MISIRNFTHRLGNQLFQIAAGASLAERNNDILSLGGWNYSYAFPNFKPVEFSLHQSPEWDEPYFHYCEIPPNYKTINGYFQSEKYFNPDKIQNIFEIDPNIVSKIKSRYNFNNSSAIHIRRGDYLGLQDHHPLVPVAFFQDALKDFGNSNVFVLSDDPDWCRATFPECQTIVGNSDIEDLCIMTLVDKIAISNSTFSWWGAWLNKNKSHVIAPKKWFGPAYNNYITKDIYCDGWDIR